MSMHCDIDLWPSDSKILIGMFPSLFVSICPNFVWIEYKVLELSLETNFNSQLPCTHLEEMCTSWYDFRNDGTMNPWFIVFPVVTKWMYLQSRTDKKQIIDLVAQRNIKSTKWSFVLARTPRHISLNAIDLCELFYLGIRFDE